jgi:acetoacetate decarboxylase
VNKSAKVVLAPVAELPVREIVSAIHIVADLTLGLGRVDLQRPIRQSLPIGEERLAT